MPRKLSRSARPSQKSSSTVEPSPPRADRYAAPGIAALTVVQTAAGGAAVPTFGETPLGRFLARVFRVLASLQLAISLLSLFTLCLIGATLLEARYSARIAQELV